MGILKLFKRKDDPIQRLRRELSLRGYNTDDLTDEQIEEGTRQFAEAVRSMSASIDEVAQGLRKLSSYDRKAAQ